MERYVAGAEQVSRSDEEIAKPFKAKLGKIPGHKQLVRENELEQFAAHVAEEIGSHEFSGMVLKEKRRDE